MLGAALAVTVAVAGSWSGTVADRTGEAGDPPLDDRRITLVISADGKRGTLTDRGSVIEPDRPGCRNPLVFRLRRADGTTVFRTGNGPSSRGSSCIGGSIVRVRKRSDGRLSFREQCSTTDEDCYLFGTLRRR